MQIMHRTLGLFALTGLLATAGGCRSGEASRQVAPGPAGDAGHSAPAHPHPLATKLCEALHALPGRRVAECCGTPPSRFLFDECLRVVSASLETDSVELDPVAVDKCAEASALSLSGCDWVTPGEPLAAPECQSLFKGKTPKGGVCRSSLECAERLHCEGLGPTKTGICIEAQAIGAGCGPHVDVMATYVLERDLERSRPFCADFCSLVSHRCEAVPTEGAPCLSAVNCAAGQSCSAGRCSASLARKAGETCAGASCGAGLVCREGRCAALAAPGEACKTDFDCRAGGCVAGPGGARACGAKCSVSFDALQNDAKLRLPVRPTAGRAPSR